MGSSHHRRPRLRFRHVALIVVVGLFSIGRSVGCSGGSTDGQMHFTHFTVAEGEVFRVDAGTEIIVSEGGRGGDLWAIRSGPTGFGDAATAADDFAPIRQNKADCLNDGTKLFRDGTGYMVQIGNGTCDTP